MGHTTESSVRGFVIMIMRSQPEDEEDEEMVVALSNSMQKFVIFMLVLEHNLAATSPQTTIIPQR